MTADEIATRVRISNDRATAKPDPTPPGDEIVASMVDGINFDIYLYGCQALRNNALYCAYDIDIDPGGTFEMLDHTLARWRSVVNSFKTTVVPA